jgi:hypothetical protein
MVQEDDEGALKESQQFSLVMKSPQRKPASSRPSDQKDREDETLFKMGLFYATSK